MTLVGIDLEKNVSFGQFFLWELYVTLSDFYEIVYAHYILYTDKVGCS